MMNPISTRRTFFAQTLGILGAAGTMAAEQGLRQEPKVSTGIQPSGRYDDSMIFERKPFKWPGGKTLAVWVVPNVEIWDFDTAVDAAIAPNGTAGPDVINYGTREYGLRIGLWRVTEVLDAAGIKATVALNSGVCEFYPRVIEELKKREWEFMGHGVTNSRSLRKLSMEEEKETIHTSLQTIRKAAGTSVRGWLSPGQGQTMNTLDLLAEAGVIYTGDWNNDDQPYRMRVKSGDMYSLPYCSVINDTNLYSAWGFSGEQYYQSVVDQFDTLAADSQKQPRVMGLPLHPFLVGQPERIKFFKQAIQHITQSENVWLATGSEIVDAYRKVQS